MQSMSGQDVFIASEFGQRYSQESFMLVDFIGDLPS